VSFFHSVFRAFPDRQPPQVREYVLDATAIVPDEKAVASMKEEVICPLFMNPIFALC
jgi:hypothetical protein